MQAAWLLSVLAPVLVGELPEELKRLERLGKVSYASYDPAVEARAHPAQADFQFDLEREYAFRYRIAGPEGRGRRVAVELTITRVEVRVSHTILLPRGWDPADPALRELMAHEYDHIAISADPSAIRLLERLLSRPITAEFVLNDTGERAIRERVERIHEEDMERTLNATVTFIDRHNARLDDLTDHGARPLPDRDTFYSSLYSPEALRGAGFPEGVLDGDPTNVARPPAGDRR